MKQNSKNYKVEKHGVDIHKDCKRRESLHDMEK